MKHNIILMLFLILLLNGCAELQSETVPETTGIPETVYTEAPTETVTLETVMPETIPVTVPPVEEEQEATQLEEGIAYYLGKSDVSWNLKDGKDFSKVDIPAGEPLRIESDAVFSGIYIRWESVPQSGLIRSEGWEKSCSEEGFLHEYIALEKPVHTLELIPSGKVGISDIFLFTEGSAPQWVQVWQPPCEEADILVFPTHADDDALFFGALIAYYALEEGRTVQTAFMVDHWYEPIRNHERLDGLWEMGVRHYPIVGTARDYNAPSIGYAINFHKEDDILGWQVQQLRRFRPLVVVGHDINGEYGHQQHILNTMYLMEAVEAAADESRYPESAQKYGIWDTPKLYLHLYGENSLPMEVNEPLSGDPAGRTAFQIAQAAYGWHKSQHRLYFQVQQGRDYPLTDCSWFGLYRSTVGEDTGWNVMENTEKVGK